MHDDMKQYLDDVADWLEWQDSYPARRYGHGEDWQPYEQAQQIYMERQAKRQRNRRLKLEAWEARPMPRPPPPQR